MTTRYFAVKPGSNTRHSAINAMILAIILAFAPLVGTSNVYAEPASSQAQVGVVNINKADAQALADGLVGVGLKRAAAIVEYRKAYGPFTSLDELEAVKGIGKATIERNKAMISLD